LPPCVLSLPIVLSLSRSNRCISSTHVLRKGDDDAIRILEDKFLSASLAVALGVLNPLDSHIFRLNQMHSRAEGKRESGRLREEKRVHQKQSACPQVDCRVLSILLFAVSSIYNNFFPFVRLAANASRFPILFVKFICLLPFFYSFLFFDFRRPQVKQNATWDGSSVPSQIAFCSTCARRKSGK